MESAFQGGSILVSDVEASYTGLFLQVMNSYEATIEEFVLGLVVKPGGIVSADRSVKARVSVKSYSHAFELASGPTNRFPTWLGKDVQQVALLLLSNGAPFANRPETDWHFVERARHIRNAIAHPSESALSKFQRLVVQGTPLPPRERSVAGYLRGAAAQNQTRWEMFTAGVASFVGSAVR